MDDIGNLAYILVFIIWFLYRVFGKGKKQSQPLPPFNEGAPAPRPHDEFPNEPPSQESTRPVMTFEDVLRELTGAPAPVFSETEPEIEEDPTEYFQEDSPTMRETSFEVLDPVETPHTSKYVLEGKFKEFNIRPERSSKAARNAVKMLKSKQGAKQAFILKEIFDRRY